MIIQGKESSNLIQLNAFQIKVIALIFMTLDHLAAYGEELFFVSRFASYFRLVGRTAAPLFLFLLVQSIYHTRNKKKFLLRLYLAGLFVGLIDTSMNFFFGWVLGYRLPGNIMFTFFYVVLYILLIENLISSIKDKDILSSFTTLFFLIVSFIPTIFYDTIYDVVSVGTSTAYHYLFQGLRSSLIPSFYDVDYGIGYIFLGIVLYFLKTKQKQCFGFLIFCLFCIVGAFVAGRISALDRISFYNFVPIFFRMSQCWMILALPFMALYNGKRGRPCKWFFYWYYPIHRQLIVIISSLFS